MIEKIDNGLRVTGPAFGVKSGAAAGAKTLTVDNLLAAKQRADLVISL